MPAAMVAAPLLLFLGNALHPVDHDRDEQAWLAGIAGHRTQWYVAHLLVFAALPLFVPAVVGLLRALGERRAGVADAGAALAVAAGFGTAGFVAVEGFGAWQMTAPGADRETMVALLERFNDSFGTFAPTGAATLAFSIGLGVLGYALLRARVEPRWGPALIVLSRAIVVVTFAVGHETGEYLMGVVAAADLLMLAGFAPLAARQAP
ncbi:MAG TPA: hypothetical protein VHF89_20845 [Solirubrobacteraceae bacterium]|nr:hypothetical protein [Solirubrobacteraceae bacterium]